MRCWRRLLLFLTAAVVYIGLNFYHSYHEGKIIKNLSKTESKIVWTVYEKQQRWDALSALNGRDFFKLKHHSDCSRTSINQNHIKPITYRSYNVYGSQDMNFSQLTDVLEHICRFRHGEKIISPMIYGDRNFPILIANARLCQTHLRSSVDLLILVKSHTDHLAYRSAIRHTWGNDSCWAGRVIKIVFVLGTSHDSNVSDKIGKEAKQHADIIQRDFIDHYHNNTHKTLFSLQWALAFCPEAKWYLLVDDDFFVNSREMLGLLDSLYPRFNSVLLAGHQYTVAPVIRNRTGPAKWAISEQRYPHSHYPNYVAGGTILVGSELALELYLGSRFTEMFPVDDAFLGFVLHKLLRQTTHLNSINVFAYPYILWRNISGILSSHGFHRPSHQRIVWRRMKLHRLCLPLK